MGILYKLIFIILLVVDTIGAHCPPKCVCIEIGGQMKVTCSFERQEDVYFKLDDIEDLLIIDSYLTELNFICKQKSLRVLRFSRVKGLICKDIEEAQKMLTEYICIYQ